jgi:hypothetical protein
MLDDVSGVGIRFWRGKAGLVGEGGGGWDRSEDRDVGVEPGCVVQSEEFGAEVPFYVLGLLILGFR